MFIIDDILIYVVSMVYHYYFLLFLIGPLSYLIPVLILSFYHNKEQDLKKKYAAEWALVTGGTSGIGLAIVHKLSAQGINVVIAALDDDCMKQVQESLPKQYPNISYRFKAIDLNDMGSIDRLDEETRDITIQLIFNNAGYMKIGLFVHNDLGQIMHNINVNAVSAIKISHLFLNRLIASEKKGCVVFTSSPAGLMPSPFSTIYGATKAFITEFAMSVAGEVRYHGIDVLVLHPSPADTNFYNNDSAGQSPSLLAFKRTATTPETAATSMFSSVGRYTVVRDQGYFSIGLRLLLKVIDMNLFAYIVSIFTPYQAEFKNLMKSRKKVE